jgi:hypothetical protein
MKEALGYRATGRKIICANDTFELREGQTSYGEANDLESGNTFLWDQQPPPLIGQFFSICYCGRPQALHRHFSGKENAYVFTTAAQLIVDFQNDIARWNHENLNS